jgi:Domain of unknown function DUF11
MKATRILPVIGLLALGVPNALAEDCNTSECKADVSVSGHSEPSPVRVREQSELKVTVKNEGPATAYGIELQINVNQGLKIISAAKYGARSCSYKGNFVKCDMGDFIREREAVVRVRVKGYKRGSYISDAKVYSMADDPNGGNGQVSMTTGVKAKNDR